MSEIIISLTTISKRINSVHSTIKSLIEQEYNGNYKIRLYISKRPYLLDEGIKKIPYSLKRYEKRFKKFSIHYCNNIGSYRKLVPLLNEKKFRDCLIITVDDDKIYKKHFLSRLVKSYFDNNKNYIICYRGFLRSNEYLLDILSNKNEVNSKVDNLINSYKNKSNKVLQDLVYKLKTKYPLINKLIFSVGNDGVLYHTRFFSPLTTNINLIKKIGHHHDDFWFRLNTLIMNIGVICINPYDIRSSIQIEDTHKSGLHQNFNKGSYKIDLLDMSHWFSLLNKMELTNEF